MFSWDFSIERLAVEVEVVLAKFLSASDCFVAPISFDPILGFLASLLFNSCLLACVSPNGDAPCSIWIGNVTTYSVNKKIKINQTDIKDEVLKWIATTNTHLWLILL